MRITGASRIPLLAVCLIAWAVLGTGCGPSDPEPIALTVQSEFETNAGRPFYLVIREVDDREYVTESYQEAAARVFSSPPDESILHREVIFPGENGGVREIAFDRPMEGEKPIGFYFFFTHPGGKWKELLAQPLPEEIRFRLNANEIEESEGVRDD